MEVYYPENIDQVSIVKDNMKTPIARLGFAETSECELFNNDKASYVDEGVISYMIQDIQRSEDDFESVVIKIVDIDNPDREFGVEVPIQYINSAFLLSQMVQAPMFFMVPSDDVEMSLGSGPYNVKDMRIAVESPVRKTPEFTKISKILYKLSEQNSVIPKNITVTEKEIDNARSQIVDIITGLLKGQPESLIQAYALHDVLQINHSLKEEKEEALTNDEKQAIIMKDFIIMLENSTHPVDMSSIFVEEKNATDYVATINDFETIMDKGLGKVFKRHLNKKPKIELTSESTHNDYLLYLASDITPDSIPAPLDEILKNAKIDYLWEFPWSSALEEDFDPMGERIADFLISAIFVIAIRLARLNVIYEMTGHPEFSPMAKIIEGLTAPGESFVWIVRESVKLLASNKDLPLFELITIPKNNEEESDINGPVGAILHGLGHEIISSGLPIESYRIALHNEPNILGFVETVFESYTNVPEELKALGEAACFMRGLVFPSMSAQLNVDKQYAEELIRAMHILAELSAVKNTEASLNSPEWKKHIEEFYAKLV